MSQNPNLARTPDYYSARAAEERKLADAAGDANARAAHAALAEHYEQLSRAAADDSSQAA
jgi:hypothetical protein